MHVAFDVAYGYDVPQREWGGEASQEKAILLPDGRAAGAIQRLHGALVVADKNVARVDREPGRARKLPRPRRVAARAVEAAYPALEGHGAHFALGDDRHTDHIGNPFELGRSARQRNGRLP